MSSRRWWTACARGGPRWKRRRGAHRSGPCRVACVGRTKAGKSTLRFVLTGQAEDGIGRGGQRTTIESIDYAWGDLVMVDTPGVGASDGDADVAAAVQAADDSDLIVWVVGSDGLQQATIEPVLRMLHREVPLLVLVNHKDTHDLADLEHLPDERLFTETVTREARLREVLAREDVHVVHVQLDVAHAAQKANHDSGRARSGIDRAAEALGAAAVEAVRDRPVVLASRIRRSLRGVHEAVTAVEIVLERQQAKATSRTAALAFRALSSRKAFKESLDRGEQGAQKVADAALVCACRFAVTEENRGKAQQRLNKDLEALRAELVEALQSIAEAAVGQAAGLLGGVARGSDSAGAQKSYDGVGVELRGDPLNARAAKTTRRFLAIATTPLMAVPGFGWGARAAIMAAPVIIEGLGGKVGPDLDEEQAKRLASVNDVKERVGGQLAWLVQQARQRAERRYSRRVAGPLLAAQAAAEARVLAVAAAVRAVADFKEA